MKCRSRCPRRRASPQIPRQPAAFNTHTIPPAVGAERFPVSSAAEEGTPLDAGNGNKLYLRATAPTAACSHLPAGIAWLLAKALLAAHRWRLAEESFLWVFAFVTDRGPSEHQGPGLRRPRTAGGGPRPARRRDRALPRRRAALLPARRRQARRRLPPRAGTRPSRLRRPTQRRPRPAPRPPPAGRSGLHPVPRRPPAPRTGRDHRHPGAIEGHP